VKKLFNLPAQGFGWQAAKVLESLKLKPAA
jgi:hypothetical protein